MSRRRREHATLHFGLRALRGAPEAALAGALRVDDILLAARGPKPGVSSVRQGTGHRSGQSTPWATLSYVYAQRLRVVSLLRQVRAETVGYMQQALYIFIASSIDLDIHYTFRNQAHQAQGQSTQAQHCTSKRCGAHFSGNVITVRASDVATDQPSFATFSSTCRRGRALSTSSRNEQAATAPPVQGGRLVH